MSFELVNCSFVADSKRLPHASVEAIITTIIAIYRDRKYYHPGLYRSTRISNSWI